MPTSAAAHLLELLFERAVGRRIHDARVVGIAADAQLFSPTKMRAKTIGFSMARMQASKRRFHVQREIFGLDTRRVQRAR